MNENWEYVGAEEIKDGIVQFYKHLYMERGNLETDIGRNLI